MGDDGGNAARGPRLKIGEVARRFGLNVRTLRYYEDIGLLPASGRTESGYRVYGDEDVERLRFIVQAKRVGFSLDEIAEVLRLGRHGRACPYVRATLARHLAALDEQIAELGRVRADLVAMQAAWDDAPAAASDGAVAGRFCALIEERGSVSLPLLSPSSPVSAPTNTTTNEKGIEMATATGKRQVEVFVAGCPLCDPVVKLVKQVACGGCEVSVYNIKDDSQAAERAQAAGVQRVPMVLVDGKPATCCASNEPVTEEGLRAAGVGAG